MDSEIKLLIEALLEQLVESEYEVAALRQVLVEKQVTTEIEIQLRIEDVRREDQRRLKREAVQRALNERLKDLPKQ